MATENQLFVQFAPPYNHPLTISEWLATYDNCKFDGPGHEAQSRFLALREFICIVVSSIQLLDLCFILSFSKHCPL